MYTHEVEQGGDEVGVGQRARVEAAEHEVEAQHARLDDVRVDRLLLARRRSVRLAAAAARRRVEIAHGAAQAVHCITHHTHTRSLGQLSLASLRGRLIEYQLRLE